MTTLKGLALVLTAAAVGLAAAGGATGKTSTARAKLRHVNGRIEALAIDGNRIAYGVEPASTRNRVVVWNVRNGRTTKVSGSGTAQTGDSSTGSGLFGLAIAGTRVAWLANVGGNTEGDDYVFASTVTNPKERKVAALQRTGDACSGGPRSVNPGCTGDWLLGLVGSGNVIALDRWTTAPPPDTGSASLDTLGTTLQPIASGVPPLLPLDVDAGRIAVLRSPQEVGLYTSSGKLLYALAYSTVAGAALSGRNLVVLTTSRKLQLFGAQTGSLRKTLSIHGSTRQKPGNLDVQGNIAIYTAG
ncbi:MAG TPA: hypothetical protein VE220_06250, partial [Gaiellaceae bacterium]|nr:hypothetical protein [Gaiellaceae bacterium]